MPQQIISLKPGERIYKYHLIRNLDSGNFGQVWLADDISVDRNVAVKVLDSSMVPIAEQLIEAQIGNQLDHSNLVKVLYADVISFRGDKIVIIAMEYFINGSIIHKLNNRGFIPIHDAIRYLTDVLRGLEYLHGKNFLHGDIKPKNILIGFADEGLLTDYGISCSAPNLIPVPSKNAYMLHIAPETRQFNQISVQTDIYQLGMTAFRLLNGNLILKQIFENVGKDGYYDLIIKGKLITTEIFLPFIPRNLKSIINKATHVDPSKRFQSALEMRRALERLKYHGYWTCDSNGNFEGINGKNIFCTQIISKKEGQFDFLVVKKNSSTGRETNVKKFSRKNVSKIQLDSISKEFMQQVVMEIM
jgi:eukaryotic-like serine/threonine-protein kinase